MQKYIRKLSILAIALLVGCAHQRNNPIDTESLVGLQSMGYVRMGRNGAHPVLGKFRETSLKETALSLGAQAGLAKRASQINDELANNARKLDAIYDFNALILEHNVQPPVLLEGRNTLNLADTQTIRISDRTYKVAKQARFVTTPPNWRQYLWMDYKKPDVPNAMLLPKNTVEKEIWRRYIARGWDNGLEQANTILEESLARIKEDFTGMILYRKLLAMNMVSPPFVSHTDLGVTGDSSEIHIDDRVLRITALPELNTDSKSWRAAVSKDESVLAQFNGMEALAKNAKIEISSNRWQPIIAPINER